MMMKRSILAGIFLLLALCLVSTAAAQVVTILLDSDPSGASVSMDDHPLTFIGETPLWFDIESGPHTLYLNEIGYKPYSSPILIPEVAFIDLGVITLEPLPPTAGGINVVTTPPNATVLIKHTGDGDGSYFQLGKAPLIFSSLGEGYYTVKLELSGYYSVTMENVLVTSGNITDIVVELVKIPVTGFAEFKTVPPGATIFIESSFVGTTPLTLELAPGTYSCLFRHDGFKDNSTTFNIVAGETTLVEATLEKVFQNVSVYFTSVPSGAEIFIDGNDQNLVTPSVIPIPYNPNGSNFHTIKLTLTGFKDFSGILDLNSWFSNLDPLYQYQDVTLVPLHIDICTNLTNGTIIPLAGDYNIVYDQPKTYNITANPGFEIEEYIIDGTPISLAGNQTFYQYTFLPSVVDNHTICANFIKYNVSVIANAGPGGTIVPPGTTLVRIGGDLTLTITPDPCNETTSVTVNGVEQGPVSSIPFTNLMEDQVVNATFATKTFFVNASSVGGTGEWATPLTQIVNCGESSIPITISPLNSYMILSIKDNGIAQSITTSYTIPDVEEDHDVVVTFGPAIFIINATAGPDGSIDPSGDVPVNYLGEQAFTITPGPCFAIADVTVDGEDIGLVTEYTFTDVTADHTISANFTPSTPEITTSFEGEGTIEPEGPVEVTCGEDQDFVITPDPCYSISEIYIDDVEIDLNTDSNLTWGPGPVGGQNVSATYLFEDVTTSHSLEVEFDVAIFNVTTIAGPNGTIEPINVTVDCNGSVTLTITPDTGFAVNEVTVNGKPVTPPVPPEGGEIIISEIQGDLVVNATFVTNAVADFEAVVQPVPEGPIPLRFLDPTAQPGMDIKFYDLSTGDGIDQWVWDFGDGNFSTQQNPIHRYGKTGLFTVSLKVHNAAGWSNPEIKTNYIDITEDPLVDFSFKPATGNVPPPFTVQFTDMTTDTTGTPHIITWDFGDGDVGTNAVGEKTPTHTYTDFGTYTVTLNIDNIIGKGSMSKEIIITGEPVADFVGFPTHGNHNLTVHFTDLSQAVVPLSTWFWNFGDGGFSTDQNPGHTYYVPGRYNVTLNVTTDLGDFNVTKKAFYIDVR